MIRNGFTLIELLVVLVILFILAALILGVTGIGGAEYDAKVVEKWTDVDYEGNPIYRATFVKSDEETVTLDTYWHHNELHKGSYYRVKSWMGKLSKVSPLPQPVEVQNGQHGLAEKP